nr:putative ribonuclease H-like domain-containing protein [Tanacetum cinerariifolium]
MFDLDYLTDFMNYEPVSVENQANKSVGPKEANNRAGTQANDDQGVNSEEINLHEEHFILPIWSAYSTTVKSSGDKVDQFPNFKTCEKPNVNTISTNLLNIVSTPLSTADPSRAFNDGELSYLNDSLMPHLEDIYASLSEGIFTDTPYDDEGVVTNFNNLETTMSVSPTPTTRIHTIHPKTQILRDPILVVQTRSKVNKNFKAHALGHRHEEVIDYDEVFAPVARIEAIRIFLAFSSYMGFIVYQMDVKSAFLYGTIDEEVHVSQPPGFVDPKFPNKVYKVVKALYTLHQAPIAWYLKGQPKLGLWYPKVSSFDLEAYSDSDYAGANPDKKSTTGGCQFLGSRLISWQCKKQTIMATSTTEAEYVAAAHCCGQVLWIQNQLLDYGFNFMKTNIYIDNESIICILKNPVFHSKMKHIEIRHHFIRNTYEKKLIQVLKIHTNEHDYSQDPRVDLKGTGGSGGDQVNLPYDSPLSGGYTSDRAMGSLNLEALFALCTNLSNMVLALETIKDAQAKEILTLKARIKNLEKRKSVSKKGRNNAKLGPTKDGSDKLDAELEEDMEYIDTKEALNEERLSIVDTARPDVSTARPYDDTARPDISTARQELSTAGPTTTRTTTTIFDDEEMTLVDTLNKMKDDKAKGVALKDSESTYRPARSILTLKPLPTIYPKDKGKGVLEEPESVKKMSKSDFDAAQIARQLEVELQAKLAVRWTHEEQEKYNVDERAKLLAEYFERRKKQLAEERATAIRNKPPTKTQLRRLMMTFLKSMGRFTHSELNKKSFEDIQGLYMKGYELIAYFVPIGSEEDERMVIDMNKKAEEESSDKGVDSIKKRKEGSRMKRMSKRQKTDVDLKEEEKLKTFLKIDPDEGVIDYEVLDKRFPIIN